MKIMTFRWIQNGQKNLKNVNFKYNGFYRLKNLIKRAIVQSMHQSLFLYWNSFSSLMKLTISLIPLLKVQNHSQKCRGSYSPEKVQYRFLLGLHFCSFSWGNIMNGEIAFLCMSDLMSNFFRIYMKRAPYLALQVSPPPSPFSFHTWIDSFIIFKNIRRETNGEGCYIERNERLSSPSRRN